MSSLLASIVPSRRRLLVKGLVGALGACLRSRRFRTGGGLDQHRSVRQATLTQPFAPLGDSNSYKLVPGGDFEGSLTGWTLTGGARRVAGSEPFGATGSVGKYSMYLPAGASVQSPYTCVDAAYPMFRFFGRNNGLLSIVAVSIVYKEPLLGPVAVPIGAVLLSPSWAPSAQMAHVVGGAGHRQRAAHGLRRRSRSVSPRSPGPRRSTTCTSTRSSSTNPPAAGRLVWRSADS